MRLLHLDLSGRSYGGPEPHYVSADYFTSAELRGAARAGAPELLESIDQALRLLDGDQVGLEAIEEVPRLVDTTSARAPGASDRVVQALHHPAMWGALLDLDPGVRRDVLAYEGAAVRALVWAFIRRFSGKMCMRRAVLHHAVLTHEELS